MAYRIDKNGQIHDFIIYVFFTTYNTYVPLNIFFIYVFTPMQLLLLPPSLKLCVKYISHLSPSFFFFCFFFIIFLFSKHLFLLSLYYVALLFYLCHPSLSTVIICLCQVLKCQVLRVLSAAFVCSNCFYFFSYLYSWFGPWCS